MHPPDDTAPAFAVTQGDILTPGPYTRKIIPDYYTDALGIPRTLAQFFNEIIPSDHIDTSDQLYRLAAPCYECYLYHHRALFSELPPAEYDPAALEDNLRFANVPDYAEWAQKMEQQIRDYAQRENDITTTNVAQYSSPDLAPPHLPMALPVSYTDQLRMMLDQWGVEEEHARAEFMERGSALAETLKRAPSRALNNVGMDDMEWRVRMQRSDEQGTIVSQSVDAMSEILQYGLKGPAVEGVAMSQSPREVERRAAESHRTWIASAVLDPDDPDKADAEAAFNRAQQQEDLPAQRYHLARRAVMDVFNQLRAETSPARP